MECNTNCQQAKHLPQQGKKDIMKASKQTFAEHLRRGHLRFGITFAELALLSRFSTFGISYSFSRTGESLARFPALCPGCILLLPVLIGSLLYSGFL